MTTISIQQSDIDQSNTWYKTRKQDDTQFELNPLDSGRISCNCPVARALHRITGKVYSVGPHSARPDAELIYKIINLPKMVTSFINAFDLGLPVQPITFELPL